MEELLSGNLAATSDAAVTNKLYMCLFLPQATLNEFSALTQKTRRTN